MRAKTARPAPDPRRGSLACAITRSAALPLGEDLREAAPQPHVGRVVPRLREPGCMSRARHG
jgi:hypothetical protein